MDDDRQRRLAANEALTRDMNELVGEVSASWFEQDEPIRFRCECAAVSCDATVSLTREEYESVRAEGTRFVIVEGHELEELEDVVAHVRGYAVVEKRGPGVDVAEATDPRA